MNVFVHANGKIEDRYLMDELVCGRSLLEHLLQLAKELKARKVIFDLPLEKQKGSQELISRYFGRNEYSFDAEEKTDEDIELDIGNVYNTSAAIKDYEKYRSVDRSVVWKIRTGEDIKAAESELMRTKWFPIGRYYIVPISKFLAGKLAKTGITANQLTMVSFAAGLAAAALLFFDNGLCRFLSAFLYITFWILDITDGKLARLKKEVSGFGKWLDPVAGEIVDYAIYLAIMSSLYFRSHNPAFLWIGIFYFIGKHLALFSMQAGEDAFSEAGEKGAVPSGSGMTATLSRCAHFIHDADVRVHFVALCVLLNMKAVPLVAYAVYFNIWVFAKWFLEYSKHKKRS